jgi:sulfonate transport system substrate-binding protein
MLSRTTILCRFLRWAAAALCVSVAVTGIAPRHGLAAEKVLMSHAGIGLMRLPLYVAVQNGYFTDAGIDLQIVDTRSGSDAMMMLAGGAVNFATGQLIDAVNLNRQGMRVQGISMLTQRLANSVVVRRALADQIKSIRDLRGRTVGVTGVGSGTWQFIAYLATLESLKPDDLQYVSVGSGSNVIGAVKSGRVDAMSYADPENPKLVSDGDAVFLVDLADKATHDRLIGESYLNNQIMVLSSYASANPKIAQGVADAIQRAINWARSHSVEEVATLVHKYPAFAGNSSDDVLFSVKRMLPDGLAKTGIISEVAFNNAIKLPLSVGALKEPMTYDRLVNPSFAVNAARAYPPPNLN